jgi:ABC-type transport system involved in Fe-S cluster assembly fused permease/ATPase subunit
LIFTFRIGIKRKNKLFKLLNKELKQMEMRYRGVSYQYNPTFVQVEGKKNEVKFRGQTYQVSQAIINLPHSSDSEVVYRGVSIATGEKNTFLGGTYKHKQIVLVPVGC